MTETAATGFIYALVGPSGIRYIGRTDRDPYQRYREHRRWADAARKGRARGLELAWNYVSVDNWWASLEEDPELVVLEEPTLATIQSRHEDIIAAYIAAGHPLTNTEAATHAYSAALFSTDRSHANRVVLAEIRSGTPYREARPPLPGFDD
jgi:hypothetical protein